MVKEYLKLMRFDKPVGIFLLFWPVAWALLLATNGRPDFKLIVIFTLGVVLMRSAGCIINDISDRKMDKFVTRTQNRPLAAGTVPLRNAVILSVILLLVAASLLLFLNRLTFYVAITAALLTCFYPLCKRFTHFPQLVLGITFNMGVLMVYAAALNTIPLQAFLLYFATIFWTLAYDTLYAMSDKQDDLKIGIKSTAIIFGKYSLLWVVLFYILFFFLLFLTTEYLLILLGLFYVGFICYQARKSNNYFRGFLQNNWLGLLLTALVYAKYF